MSSTRAERVHWHLLLALGLLAASLGLVGQPADARPTWSDDASSARIVVGFQPGVSAAAERDARRAIDAQALSELAPLGARVWRVEASGRSRALEYLQRVPHVRFAELDTLHHPDDASPVTPNDPSWSSQWGPKLVNAPTAWATTTGEESVVIAVVDSGVNDIGDLRGKLTRGFNALDGTSDVSDSHGHGTNAASVASANTDNGTGIAAYCWRCRIMPVKVFETGGAYISDAARGMTWATDNGADVISYSLSGESSSSTMQSAVRYATSRGVIVVASAGNHGSNKPRYPAAYSEVIGVAGTTSTDGLYSWSNYGDWVEVSAPGSNHAITRTGGTTTFSGTSSATPAVAGVVGLGLAIEADPSEVRSALQSTAVPLAVVRHGRIDAGAMVAGLRASVTAPVTTPEPSPAPDASPAPEVKCHPVKGCEPGGPVEGGRGKK